MPTYTHTAIRHVSLIRTRIVWLVLSLPQAAATMAAATAFRSEVAVARLSAAAAASCRRIWRSAGAPQQTACGCRIPVLLVPNVLFVFLCLHTSTVVSAPLRAIISVLNKCIVDITIHKWAV